MEPILMSQSQAARLLGVSPQTVGRLVARGTLEAVRLDPQSSPRVRRLDVLKLVTLADDAEAAARP